MAIEAGIPDIVARASALLPTLPWPLPPAGVEGGPAVATQAPAAAIAAVSTSAVTPASAVQKLTMLNMMVAP